MNSCPSLQHNTLAHDPIFEQVEENSLQRAIVYCPNVVPKIKTLDNTIPYMYTKYSMLPRISFIIL